MPVAKFDISEAAAVGKHLGLAIEAAAQRALLSTAHRIVQRITTVVIPAEKQPPIDRRIYAAGWRARPTRGGAMVENTVPHGIFIESGVDAKNVKPGRAMLDALAAWVKRKGLVSHVAKASRDQEARSIAWAIAMSMKKKGIFGGAGKGLKILEKGLRMTGKFFAEELRREIKRETR